MSSRAFRAIPGADATTYVPVGLDVGQTLRVVVTYTDLHGTLETLQSTSTGGSSVKNGKFCMIICRLLHIMRWVWMTALGREVLPEV